MADEWTRAMVADRLELAADVMRSMPPVRPQGYVSAWPGIHLYLRRSGWPGASDEKAAAITTDDHGSG